MSSPHHGRSRRLLRSEFITRKQLASISGGTKNKLTGEKYPNLLGLVSPISYTGGAAVATKNELISHIVIKEQVNTPLPQVLKKKTTVYELRRSCARKGNFIKRDVLLMQKFNQPSIALFWEPLLQPGGGGGAKGVQYVGHWTIKKVVVGRFEYKNIERCARIFLQLDRYDKEFETIIQNKVAPTRANKDIASSSGGGDDNESSSTNNTDNSLGDNSGDCSSQHQHHQAASKPSRSRTTSQQPGGNNSNPRRKRSRRAALLVDNEQQPPRYPRRRHRHHQRQNHRVVARRGNSDDDETNQRYDETNDCAAAAAAAPEIASVKKEEEKVDVRVGDDVDVIVVKEEEEGENNNNEHRRCLEDYNATEVARLVKQKGHKFKEFAQRLQDADIKGSYIAEELRKGDDHLDNYLKKAGLEDWLFRDSILRTFKQVPTRRTTT